MFKERKKKLRERFAVICMAHIQIYETLESRIITHFKEMGLLCYNLEELDPVDSTVRHKMMKLCTGSV